MPPASELRFVPIPAAGKRFNATRQTLWRWEKDGRFPKRVPISLPTRPAGEVRLVRSPGRPRKEAADAEAEAAV